MSKAPEYVPLHNIETKELHSQGFNILNLDGKGGKGYDSSQLHRHTFFELFLFTGGKGDHEIDFMHYPVDKNSVHFVSPGQIHKLSLKKTQGYVLCFTEDFVSLQPNESFVERFPFYDSGSYPIVSLNKVLSQEIITLVCSISSESSRDNDSVDILRSYLTILLLKVKHAWADPEEKNSHPVQAKNAKVTQFKNLVQEHFLVHRPISDYASQLNITPNHLNALCKKHEGKTAIQLLQDRLLLESKRLLYATDMTVKEVSFHLNFEDVPYFNRFFKKQTRLTPVEYRQQIQKNH